MILSAISTVGTTRQENQDSYYVAQLDDDVLLAGVFDGMGGMENGAKASSTVLNYIRQAAMDASRLGILDIEAALYDANHDIYATRGSGISGSTATVALVMGTDVRIWHCGDTRAIQLVPVSTSYHGKTSSEHNYRIVNVLTHDDTAYNKYYKEAVVPRAKYNDDKYKSVLVRAIGVERDPKLSIFDTKLNRGDTLLLGSDGFWHVFDNGSLPYPRVFQGNMESCVRCIENLGERDNITAVSIEKIGL